MPELPSLRVCPSFFHVISAADERLCIRVQVKWPISPLAVFREVGVLAITDGPKKRWSMKQNEAALIRREKNLTGIDVHFTLSYDLPSWLTEWSGIWSVLV